MSRANNPFRRSQNDIVKVVELTLEEIYLGKQVTEEIEHLQICNECKGNKVQNPSDKILCNKCNGRGMNNKKRNGFEISFTCKECKGLGFVIKNPCKNCNGIGFIRIFKKISKLWKK